MSREEHRLPEIIQSVSEALSRGDLEGFLVSIHPDVEFTSLIAESEGETFHGHEGVRRWWQSVRGAFEEVRWEYLETREAGERGIAKIRISGILSGVPVEQTMWQAITLREGRAVRWSLFRSESEALEAVGLTTPSSTPRGVR